MRKNEPVKPARNAASTREDRLKAALKANMAKRKAQARAKADETTGQNITGKKAEE